MKTKTKTLHRKHLEAYEDNRRDLKDKRKRVAWAVFSYINKETGTEYRKSFTSKPYTPETEMWKLAPTVISI